MKSYTIEEFRDYIKTVKFEELEDLASFISEYFDHYKSVPDTDVAEKELALGKYIILITEYGMAFVSFTLSVIEMRKKMQEEAAQEETEGTA